MLSFKTWRQDIQASFVVFLVALPLCLGIALASNAPLSAGIFAGIIGGIITGALSGSHISVSGPAAGLTVIVAGAIQSLGSFETFTLALFFAGLLQIVFGLVGAGKIGDYFPTSVIKGMLAAIGLILILKQLPHAVGYDVDYIGNESFNQLDGENTFTEILLAFSWLHWGAVIVSISAIGVMLFWEKASKRHTFFKLFPGALVAVLLGITFNEIFKSNFPALALESKHLVTLPFEGGLQDLLSGLRMPDWASITNPKVYKVVITLAIIASLESLLSVDAADKLESSGNLTSKNRELLAQGVGNTISGLIGGLPITAVIVRTSANCAAGAKSNLSAFMHGIWLFICVALIPHMLNLIPLAALASVLLLVGYKLTNPGLFKEMLSKGMNQFIPFIATVMAIMLTDLLVGILFGIAVGFIFVLRSNSRKSIVVVDDGIRYLIRFHKDVSFLQKSRLLKIFSDLPAGSTVIIDGSKNVFIDNDIIELIQDFVKSADSKNIRVDLKKSSLALNNLFKDESYG